jgi:hypothetical protein
MSVLEKRSRTDADAAVAMTKALKKSLPQSMSNEEAAHVASALSELWSLSVRVERDIQDLASHGDHEVGGSILVSLEILDRNYLWFKDASEELVGGSLLTKSEEIQSIQEDLNLTHNSADVAKLIYALCESSRAMAILLSTRDLLALKNLKPGEARKLIRRRVKRLRDLSTSLLEALGPH